MSLLGRAGTLALSRIRLDPHLACNFYVEIDGLIAGQFQDVSGLSGSIDVHEYAEGGRNEYKHRIPGPASYSNLVLSHGMTDLHSLWGWYADVSQGITYRKNITIMMLDGARMPILWWDIKAAIPVKWTGPHLNGASGEVAVESLELIHNGISKGFFSDAVSAVRLGFAIANSMK